MSSEFRDSGLSTGAGLKSGQFNQKRNSKKEIVEVMYSVYFKKN